MGRHLAKFNDLKGMKGIVSENGSITYIHVELALVDAQDVVILPIFA